MTMEDFLEKNDDDLQLHTLACFVAGVSLHDVARRIRQQSIDQAIRTTKVCYLSGYGGSRVRRRVMVPRSRLHAAQFR
jgi:hypothetical protein